MDISTNLKVGYCKTPTGHDLSHPFITVDIIYGGIKINWFIGSISARDISIWKDIKESLYNTDVSSGVFGGGGNSSWYCECSRDKFHFSYDISGMGGDSHFSVDIPRELMQGCAEKIINIIECAARGERYEE